MKPIFLTKEVYRNLIDGICDESLLQELKKTKIALSGDDEDAKVISWLRSKVPQPAINIGYFILSECCNLACRYCFVGENSRRERFDSTGMTIETAELAISFLIKQLELADIDFTESHPQIIFFGGEPLLNFETLTYVAKRITELRSFHAVLQNAEMTVITNGTLLTKERLLEMRSYGVSVNISIDGTSRKANENRVYPSGIEAYDQIISALDLCVANGVKPSLSVTLSEATIEDLDGLLILLKKYDVRGLGYNIMLSSDDYPLPDEYYEKASQFIIDSFKIFREAGIYEDRIMRKLDCFAHSQIHFSDCGATAGGQLVFTPDGRVGICQGLIAEKEFFATDVLDDSFDARSHEVWTEWAKLSPINNDECMDCEALGICGGGCPVNARALDRAQDLNCIDPRQCVHSKRTLEFLIKDLYKHVVRD